MRFRKISSAILMTSLEWFHQKLALNHLYGVKRRQQHVQIAVNTVPADVLALLGAGASADTVMTKFGSCVH